MKDLIKVYINNQFINSVYFDCIEMFILNLEVDVISTTYNFSENTVHLTIKPNNYYL